MAKTVEVKCRCGTTFKARVADRKRGWGKFCSKSCKAVEQEKRTGQYAALLQESDRDPENPSGSFIIGAALDGK